jgi:hypothetical protein
MRNELPVPLELKAGWAPETVQALWRPKKSPILVGFESPAVQSTALSLHWPRYLGYHLENYSFIYTYRHCSSCLGKVACRTGYKLKTAHIYLAVILLQVTLFTLFQFLNIPRHYNFKTMSLFQSLITTVASSARRKDFRLATKRINWLENFIYQNGVISDLKLSIVLVTLNVRTRTKLNT